MIFSANRSHWFSACELAIYVLTGGGHSIATHQDRPMFTNRTHYMMEECKRILNGDSTAHVLRASTESWNTVIVVNEPIEASELDSASPPQQQDSAEDSISDIDLANLMDKIAKGLLQTTELNDTTGVAFIDAVIEKLHSDIIQTEQDLFRFYQILSDTCVSCSEQESLQQFATLLEDCVTHLGQLKLSQSDSDAEGLEPAAEKAPQIFRATTSNRDDWLHRVFS
jgi:hypothetical protein